MKKSFRDYVQPFNIVMYYIMSYTECFHFLLSVGMSLWATLGAVETSRVKRIKYYFVHIFKNGTNSYSN